MKGWLDKYQGGGNVAVSDATRTKVTKNTGLKKGVDQPISNMLDITLGAPQRQAVRMITGKEQSPSEAMNIKNPYGAFAADAILDPANLVGAGLLGKAAKASTKTGVLSNAYKINPFAFKPNPKNYYRGIGRTGLDDAIESGVLRPPVNSPYKDRLYMTPTIGETSMYNKNTSTYKGDPFGGINDSWEVIPPKDNRGYIAEIPQNKVNFTINNDIGNTGSGYSTIHPNISDVKLYKEHWLQGYKEVPKKENGGWLDKYNDGGPVQPNYNDYSVSAGPGFEGDGYSNVGRNYSPAWGGQFAMGGSIGGATQGIPGATGFMYARTGTTPSNGKYAKKTMASAQDGKTIYSGMLPEITVVGSKDPQTEEYYRNMIDRLTKEEGLEEGVLQSDPIYNNTAEVDEVFSNPISTNKILGRYEGLMGLGKKYGFPKVHPIDKNSLLSKVAMSIGGDKKSPANYDPSSKTIQADNTKQWVSEMAHHVQMKDNELNKVIQWMGNDLPALVASEIMLGNRKGPYYTPGAVEHEAHSIIEPKLVKEIKKSESDYKKLPYINKLKDEFYEGVESLQNGGEMRYYQEGLDFKPKSISKNGGWLSKYEEGGVIQDDMGQYNHPGEITEIGSNQITMQGVPYPVLGISDTGDMQMMYPDEEYEYDGESVTEYPMMKQGGQLTKLDQLSNFTNYNTKQPGSWLDKYQ
jgi:hypothetical protein